MSDHPAVEPVARYLCRDYWCDEERWDEFVEQARAVVEEVREVGRIARVWAVGDPEPEDCVKVLDGLGRVWLHQRAGWVRVGVYMPYSWECLLTHYGPVTEVREP